MQARALAARNGEEKMTKTRVDTMTDRIQELEAALRVIVELGGNLPDDRLTTRTGPNDAAQRGLMYVHARQIALHHLPVKVEP